MPFDPVHGDTDREWVESIARGGACIVARIRKVIGPVDYLEGMTLGGRAYCDWWCAATFRACQREMTEGPTPLSEEPFEWPEWEQLDVPLNATLKDVRDHYEDRDDITKLSDSELNARLAEVHRDIAASDERMAELKATGPPQRGPQRRRHT